MPNKLNDTTKIAQERYNNLREFKQVLSHKLTQEEFNGYAKKLAEVKDQKASHEAHAKQVKDDLKAKASAIAAEEQRLAGIVITGNMPVEAICVERIDFERNARETVRLDTGAVIETHALTEPERRHQLEMFNKKALAEAAAAAKTEEDTTKSKARPPYPDEKN